MKDFRGLEMTVDIDEMPAGPEMDALIAEVVMGWTVVRFENGAIVTVEIEEDGSVSSWDYNPGEEYYAGFKPSTRVRDSRQVLDRLVELCPGIAMELSIYPGKIGDPEKYCWSNEEQPPKMAGLVKWGVEGWGDTETLALCRAAYKAVRYLVKVVHSEGVE